MQTRGLLAAVLVLAVLGGAVWYSRRTEKNKKEAEDPERPHILKLASDDIRSIEIKPASGETTRLERDASGNWKITAPAEYRADSDAVTSLVTLLANLPSNRVIEQQLQSPENYGLKPPALEVTVRTKDGKQTRLLIGDKAPAGWHYYAMKEGDPRLFALASYDQTSLNKTAADLRDKRLLTFDSEKLVRFELKLKAQTIEFGKNGLGEWQIVKPALLRADGWQVEEALRKLKDASLDPKLSDEDQKKYAAAFAKGSPVAVATVADSAGTQTLEIRKSGEDYYATSTVVAGVHKLSSDIGTSFDKKLDDFRQKKLFDFGWDEVSRVEYHEGSLSIAVTKSGEKWTAGGKEMDSISVQNLIDRLRDLTASGFATGGASTPSITVTVVSKQGKRTEKVLIWQSGDKQFAVRENEPAVYALAKESVDGIRQAAKDVRQAPPAKPEAQKPRK